MPEKGEAMPELSARQSIVVIADEAHRSQYRFGGKVSGKTGEMSNWPSFALPLRFAYLVQRLGTAIRSNRCGLATTLEG